MVVTVGQFIIAANKSTKNNWMPIWLLVLYEPSEGYEIAIGEMFYQREGPSKEILAEIKKW